MYILVYPVYAYTIHLWEGQYLYSVIYILRGIFKIYDET